ncbi:MAG TPA: DHHA1 domain-containing protein [Terracidiphilus sp.]
MSRNERLYYADSTLKTFTAAVSGLRELGVPDGEPLWQIALDRSAFYPTSGGQPFDTGMLQARLATGATAEVAVAQVEEDDEGTVWHYARQPLAEGTHVEGFVDWDRRFDHMQQHTGQHLLSAVFWEQLQAATVSFHLGEITSTIDLAIAPPAHHSLERVERTANQIIAEDRTVTTRFVPRAEAEALLAEGILRKLPEREGTIRLVDIAELDHNACGGTHVRSTGQIGSILIRSIEKVSRGVRVEFVCGMRAVRTARNDSGILREVSTLLSTGAPELPDAVTRLLNEAKAGARERQKLREELASYQGAALAAEAEAEGGVRMVVRSWKDRDSDYVKLLASRTAAAATSTAVVFSAAHGEPVRVYLARSLNLNFNCGQMLREALAALGLRGGGSPDLAQGDVPVHQYAALVESLIAAIRHAER